MIPVPEALQERLAEYRKLCLSCAPADRDTFEEGAREIYALQGHKFPNRIVWFDNPFKMAGVILALNKSCVPRARNVADEVFLRELQYAVEHPIAPPMWGHGMSAYFLGGGLSYPQLALRSFQKDERTGMLEAFVKTCKSAGPWDLSFNYIAVCERPLSIMGEKPFAVGTWPHRTAFLHNEDGPAIVWRGAYQEYFCKGVQIPEGEFIARQKQKESKHA